MRIWLKSKMPSWEEFIKVGEKTIPLTFIYTAVAMIFSCWLGWLYLPEMQSLEYWSHADGPKSTSRSEALRNVGLFVVGFIGVGFAIWRTLLAARQTDVSEQGHITERFSTAIEHLGSENLPVRLGGIYALWRLLEDKRTRQSDVSAIFDILCAFVRTPPHPVEPPQPDPEDETKILPDKIRPDVQAIMTLLGKPNSKQRQRLPIGYRYDLRGADLREAELEDCDFSHARLDKAILSNSQCRRTDFYNARFCDTDFKRASLIETNLFGADLRGAKLINSRLSNTKLNFAELGLTNLTGSNLLRADLRNFKAFAPPIINNANFLNAKITPGSFSDCDVSTAKGLPPWATDASIEPTY